jgi:hypothetical protein
LLQQWEQTGQTLLDTDDAMRLTQTRAWFAGHGVDPESAERLMRALWPPLWLLPTMAGVVAIA